MVIDPNGQVSVSYFDMAGRVIATALAGQNPAELMPLLSEDMQDTILKTEARQLTAVCLYASKIACGEALKQLKKVRQSFDCQPQLTCYIVKPIGRGGQRFPSTYLSCLALRTARKLSCYGLPFFPLS